MSKRGMFKGWSAYFLVIGVLLLFDGILVLIGYAISGGGR